MPFILVNTYGVSTLCKILGEMYQDKEITVFTFRVVHILGRSLDR